MPKLIEGFECEARLLQLLQDRTSGEIVLISTVLVLRFKLFSSGDETGISIQLRDELLSRFGFSLPDHNFIMGYN